MAKIPFDYSYERGGRPLPAWLLDLVSPDQEVRIAAGEALGGMWLAYPSYSTKITEMDFESVGRRQVEHMERFAAEVRAAVEQPDFPKTAFVQQLCLLLVAISEDNLRTTEQMSILDDKHEAFEDRLIKRMVTADGEPERDQAVARWARMLCARMSRDDRLRASSENSKASGMMSRQVFKALDVALLSDRDSLRAMLQYKPLFFEASDALTRIGPPAIDFAPFLLDRLDHVEDNGRYDGAKPLAAIGKDDPQITAALISRLKTGSQAVYCGVIETLEYLGPHLAGREEEALRLLLKNLSRTIQVNWRCLVALASVGRDSEDALQVVLHYASPRPPRWISVDWAFNDDSGVRLLVDAEPGDRGAAIIALGYFVRFPEQVVPALIRALDTFEEFEPDFFYYGEHERVCRSLEKFGPLAAPAIPRIREYLEKCRTSSDDERVWPKDAFNVLRTMGSVASSVLPTLEQMRRDALGDDADSDYDCTDPLDQAIVAIRQTSCTNPG